MPSPEYGEASKSVEVGKVYEAVISQVVSLGHQEYQGVSRRKYYIAFDIPSEGMTRALNNFGVYSWTSKNKAPFVGLYEVFCAVEKRELTPKEAEAYDIFQIAGKSVSIEFAENEKGFLNVSAVTPCANEVKTTNEILTFGISEIGTEAMEKLPKNVYNLVGASKEYVDAQYKVTKDDLIEVGLNELEENGETTEEMYDRFFLERVKTDVNPDKVPF